MKISVIIPVYNEEQYISTCLQHLFDQTRPADEIIIVDNNCTDNTIKLAQEFDVRIIKETEQGMIPARNAGFDAAKYEILARCDADTHVSNIWIETILESFQDEKVVGVSGPIIFYDLPEVVNQLKLHNSLFFDMSKIYTGHNVLFGCNMAIRKSVWEEIKPNVCLDDSAVHEDLDLSIWAAKKGKIMFNPHMMSGISSRRMKHKPFSFFVEYPHRFWKTILYHKDNLKNGN
jgi:glycosyltransferase involved in cell wall biosynthesis